MKKSQDERKKWLRMALEEAWQAGASGDVPVGAVVVRDGEVIGRGQNRVERFRDPTAHAEILAIRDACAAIKYERLIGATLYVTLEPCAMCAGAIVQARLENLVFGASDPKTGACGSLLNIVQDRRLNHQVNVAGGILAGPCSDLLKDFFNSKRSKGKSRIEPRESERCESG